MPNRAGNAYKQSGDVQRAGETVDAHKAQLTELEVELQAELASLETDWSAKAEQLEEIAVRPKATDITLQFCGIGWLPFFEDEMGNPRAAWQERR